MDGLVIRLATLEDAAAVAGLAVQLGYVVSQNEAAARLAELSRRADHAVYVAVLENEVVGWIHLYVDYSLMDDPLAMVGGLVVDAGHRGRGIGRQLMAQAETWGRVQGCAAVYLKTNVIRQAAHAFYESLGYCKVKTQYAYRKAL